MPNLAQTPFEDRIRRWVANVRYAMNHPNADDRSIGFWDLPRRLFSDANPSLDSELEPSPNNEQQDVVDAKLEPLFDDDSDSSQSSLAYCTQSDIDGLVERLKGYGLTKPLDSPLRVIINTNGPPPPPVANSIPANVLGRRVFYPPPGPADDTFHRDDPVPQVKARPEQHQLVQAAPRKKSQAPKAVLRRSLINPSIVDKILGDVPSKASEHSTYTIELLARRGKGGMSATYRAQLRPANPVGRAGPLVFTKLVSKKDLRKDRYVELKAYERLATVRDDDNVLTDCDYFVVKLQAFFERTVDPDVMFVFKLHVCDLHQEAREIVKYDSRANYKLWLAQIAGGIQHLHRIGIIHRDVKPANVVLDWCLNACITDLGLAWVSPDGLPLDHTKNYAFRNVGTPGFTAPEVQALAPNPTVKISRLRDPGEANPKNASYGLKVDWWSFGVTAYELACTIYGSPRWKLYNKDFMDLLKARKQTATTGNITPWADALNARHVPQELHLLLFMLLCPKPENRAGFDEIYLNPYFLDKELQCSMFADLAHISSKRQEIAKPEDLYKRELADNLTITAQWKANTSGDTLSWINAESKLFDGLA